MFKFNHSNITSKYSNPIIFLDLDLTMSISSALSSESDEKQLLVHQTSGTTIVSIEDFADFATHCPSMRMNKATSLSDAGAAAMNTTSCRGSMTSFDSTSSGGIGSIHSHSNSSRHCSHSPSG